MAQSWDLHRASMRECQLDTTLEPSNNPSKPQRCGVLRCLQHLNWKGLQGSLGDRKMRMMEALGDEGNMHRGFIYSNNFQSLSL